MAVAGKPKERMVHRRKRCTDAARSALRPRRKSAVVHAECADADAAGPRVHDADDRHAGCRRNGDEAGIAVMGHDYSALALHRGAAGNELVLYRGKVTARTAEGVAEEEASCACRLRATP